MIADSTGDAHIISNGPQVFRSDIACVQIMCTYAVAVRLTRGVLVDAAGISGLNGPMSISNTPPSTPGHGDDERGRLVTVGELAAALHVSPRQVRRLAETGALRSVRVGTRLRFQPGELDRVLHEGAPQPVRP
jgi:excisionase family DNA binding protein